MRRFLLITGACLILSGCSQTIYERKKDENNQLDQGIETKVKLEGPRAVMETKF